MSLPRWLRSILLFLLFGLTAGGGAIVGHVHQPVSVAPPLSLPAEVHGRPGRLVTVRADTPASLVRWHACRGADVPDLWHAPDGKTLLFSTPTAGRYELIAWTASGGLATEGVSCTVVIETPEPPVPPEPVDPFEAALKAAWDGETSSERVAQRDQLASLYRVAGQETVRQPQLHTVGDLLAALQQAARVLLSSDALPRVRAAIAAELRAKLPTAPDQPLDAATRDRCAEQFARVAKALESLR